MSETAGLPDTGVAAEQHGATSVNEAQGGLPTLPAPAPTTAPARVRRRATLAAVPGSDPHPGEAPLMPRGTDENDARLREGKPPHWG